MNTKAFILEFAVIFMITFVIASLVSLAGIISQQVLLNAVGVLHFSLL